MVSADNKISDSYLKLMIKLFSCFSVKRKRHFLSLIILMFIASFAEVISIGLAIPFIGILSVPEMVFNNPLAKPFIDLLNINNSKELVLPLTILFAIAVVLSSAIRLLLMYLQTFFGNILGFDFGFEIYKRTLYQPYQVHVKRNSSEVIVGVSQKVNALVSNIIMPFMNIVSSVILVTTVMITFLTINLKVALIVFSGFALIYSCILIITKKKLYIYGEIVNTEQVKIHKFLQEGLNGIRDILINGTQKIYLKMYKNADLPFRTTIAKIQFTASMPKFVIECIVLLSITFVAYFLLNDNLDIIVTLPLLGAFALGAQKLLPFLQQIFYGITNMRGSKATLIDVLDLYFQTMPKYYYVKNIKTIPLNEMILLDNISFYYEKKESLIIKKLNLSIKKGSRIGIIGKTGSGKSTLLDIIMGLIHPTEGNVIIDKTYLKNSNIRGWQSQIAHVPQSIFLSDASIAENIAFGVSLDEININKVIEAAKQAAIHDIIENWQEKYNTHIGESGMRLSGGQKQRIGIARAFYKDKKIIVFDEATSSLDTKTEKIIMDNINRLDKEITLIIVAHRLTTLSKCSAIVELDKGKIINISSYSDI